MQPVRCRRVVPGPTWSLGLGGALIAFGWTYPHFLAAPPLTYVYAAPVGLVPCPTLSIAIGFALLVGDPVRKTWRIALAALGLCYGLFGVLRLGVLLDLGLVAGAGVLFARALLPHRTQILDRHALPAH